MMATHPALVLDVSRLVSRRERSAPTGIDRVEIDAAKKAISQARTGEVYFMATRGPHSWFLPIDQIEKLVNFLNVRWTSGDGSSNGRTIQLFEGLGLSAYPPSIPVTTTNAPPRIDNFRSPRAILRTRKVERRLSRPDVAVTYRNVSHHHLDKEDFLSSLKTRWCADIEVFWHDAIPISYPEYSRPGDADRHWRRLRATLDFADTIIVNSSVTEHELRSLSGERDFNIPIQVEHLKTNLPTPSPVLKAARPYFITVGTIEPRKNHSMLLHVWRSLAAKLREDCPHLVIAGRRGWMNSDVFAMLDRCPVLHDTVHEAPELADASLASLVQSATALLMPSFAEGFGLPFLEAQELGTPVIASDLKVFDEIAIAPFTRLSPLAGDRWMAEIEHANNAATIAR